MGIYQIEIDTMLDQKDQHIYIRLWLGSDSLFTYEMVGLFRWCPTSVFAGKGKWFYEDGWVYFRPDEVKSATDNFILVPPKNMASDKKAELYSRQNYVGLPCSRIKTRRCI